MAKTCLLSTHLIIHTIYKEWQLQLLTHARIPCYLYASTTQSTEPIAADVRVVAILGTKMRDWSV